MASSSFGGPAGRSNTPIPIFILISRDNNPLNAVLTIQTRVLLQFTIYDIVGKYVGQMSTPSLDNQFGSTPTPSPFRNSINLGSMNIRYPTILTIYVQNPSTLQLLGVQRIQVLGGDIYECRLTFSQPTSRNTTITVVSNGVLRNIDTRQIPDFLLNREEFYMLGQR